MRTALVVVLLLAGCTAGPFAIPGDEAAGERRAAIVVASNPLAAEAGAAMLRAGGSAIDAAVAVQMALTVVEPQSSGIGGGTFLLYHDAASGDTIALDGREVAPAAATPDMFLLPTGEPMPYELAHQMGIAVGVPGAVKLWEVAWERWGALPWARTFEPAIAHAEEGFEVDRYFAAHLANATHQQKLRAWPASARVFFHDAVCAPELPAPPPLLGSAPCVGGLPYAEGETLRQPDLAATLRLLADEGSEAFYAGPMAEAIVGAATSREGRLATSDLAAYEVVEREPVRVRLGGRDLVSMPPPAGGVIVLQFLGIMDGFAAQEHGEVATMHLEIEALRRAYADRVAYLADPAFVEVPVEGMLHPDYLAARRADIDPERASAAEPGDPWHHQDGDAPTRRADLDAEGTHTSHFVVVDHAGNVATSTTSIEDLFGSGMVVPGYGFLLNNHMTDFSFEPGGPNEVEPGKRPRSAQSPTLALEDGEPVLALGASGGPRIIAAVGLVALHALAHGQSVGEAVEAPRVMPLAFPTLRWDEGLPTEARAALEERGHAFQDRPLHVANAQAALLVEGAWVGAADTRAAPGAVVVVP